MNVERIGLTDLASSYSSLKVLSITIVPILTMLGAGCELEEVRLKTKSGVEYRRTNSDKSEAERYLVQETVQFKWDNGVDTSLQYRRRDVSDSTSGDHDDGIWFEVGFPIWKKPKPADHNVARIEALESRIARLESMLKEAGGKDIPEPTNQ